MSITEINMTKHKKIIFFLCLLFVCSKDVFGQSPVDSAQYSRPHIYQLGFEARPGYIFPTNRFLKGENNKNKRIEEVYSTHFRYSFQFRPDSYVNKIYRGVYQGIGFAHYGFGNKEEVGNPLAIYLFQGATIAPISRRISLNYEWNFGISGGWKPYHEEFNSYNGMMGSKFNAYMNANFYFKQQLSPQFDLIYGATLTHFSNGNTQFPNAGLNATDVKIGLTYNFNRKSNNLSKALVAEVLPVQKFPRHISTDVVLFGSWRRKGFIFEETPMISPDTYHVVGFNINPMYNMNYNLRFGLSLDGVYDSSANVYTEDYIIGMGQPDPGYTFYKPSSIKNQLALGVSARGEYVMPYFTVGLGIGANVLHGGGDLKGLYQTLALKIEVTRNSFIHIGYNLQNFKEPNYLMLGVGYRFGNKYPCFYRE